MAKDEETDAQGEGKEEKEKKRKNKLENKGMRVEAKDDICWGVDSKSGIYFGQLLY